MHDLRKIQKRISKIESNLRALRKDRKDYSTRDFNELIDIYKKILLKKQY